MIIENSFHLDSNLLSAAKGPWFPWYFQDFSTSYTFPFMSHAVIARSKDADTPAQPNSAAWGPIKKAVERFCFENSIALDQYLRVAFNLTMAAPNGYCRSDMHVDQKKDHFVLIAYLNSDCSGDTIIFDKKFTDSEPPQSFTPATEPPGVQVKHRVSPRENWAVCFDGRYYHAAEFCNVGERRIVLVVNFTGVLT